MEESLYLAFVDEIGRDDDKWLYRFDFTIDTNVVWGIGFNVVPAASVPKMQPDKNCLSFTSTVSMPRKMELAKRSTCYSMQDCIDWVVAMGWFDIDNPNTTDSNGRTISFRFGEKFETVKDEALELAKADAVAQKEKAILEEIKQKVSKGETVAENDDFTVSKDVTVARSDNKFSPMFNLNIFAITDKVNAGVIANDNKVVKLAVLKSVETAKDEETEEFAKFIRTQLVQFKQNKLDSMITSGARNLCDIEYDESAIDLVIQQDKGQN